MLNVSYLMNWALRVLHFSAFILYEVFIIFEIAEQIFILEMITNFYNVGTLNLKTWAFTIAMLSTCTLIALANYMQQAKGLVYVITKWLVFLHTCWSLFCNYYQLSKVVLTLQYYGLELSYIYSDIELICWFFTIEFELLIKYM